MSEASQPPRQEGNHEHSGDLHLFNIRDMDVDQIVAGARDAIATLRSLIPSDQIYNFEQIMNVLRKLSTYEKEVNELKYVHNMLHELELALTILEPLASQFEMKSIMLNVDVINSKQEKYAIETSWRSMKRHWQTVVVPIIQKIRDFAAQGMKFLKDPPLNMNAGILVGPEWILGFLALQDDFEKNLEEYSSYGMHDLAAEFLNGCQDHLFRIDRRLLSIISQLDQLSDQILRSMTDDSIKP